jgi:3-hydroxyacyl-CoA dehydrogenase
VSEEYILRLEKEAFLELLKNEKTMERIDAMLENGKPLRN